MTQRKPPYTTRFARNRISRPAIVLIKENNEQEKREDFKKEPLAISKIIEYRQSLNNSSNESLSSFEKNFLLISGGLLAFSITFIKDLVDIGDLAYLFLLFIGWGLIACSIGMMMFTFISSAYISIKISESLTTFIRNKEKTNDTTTLSAVEEAILKTSTDDVLRKSRAKLKFWRFVAIALFLLGVSVFGAFAGINLYRKNNLNKKQESSIIMINTKSQGIQVNNISIQLTDSTIIIQDKKSSKPKN